MSKDKTNQNGITLIALVITIIVMLILVGVSVTVALNGGLFSTAKEAAEGTASKRNEELNLSDGKVEINGEWYNSIDEYVNEGNSNESNEDIHFGIIPKGATYQVCTNFKADWDNEYSTDLLEEGEPFPETISQGDLYTYGGYTYSFNSYYSGWYMPNETDGWTVDLNSSDEEVVAGKILSSVNGKPVNSMENFLSEFWGNKLFIELIPSTIVGGSINGQKGAILEAYYEGTMDEWKLAFPWMPDNYDSCIIHCSDGSLNY